MAGWDHVHNLMVELGDLMDLPQVSEYADQSVWHLVTKAGSIEVDYDDVGDRILLSMPIGVPDGSKLEPIYESLLLHNGSLPASGGVHAGTEELGGEVVLMREHAAAGLDVQHLRTLVEQLMNVAGTWRERLRDLRASAPGVDAGGFRPDLIRG
jgi:hypothetical protein